jgi:hypothetical protein
MSKLLDFDKEEKGFFKVYPSNRELKRYVGRDICYVDYVEPYRGTYFVRHGTIVKIKYNTIYLSEDGSRTVDIRDIKEIGVKEIKK